MSSVARQRNSMRLRGRSYMAFALAPEPPIADWLTELDNWLRASPDFFAIRPVVLDLSGVTLTTPAISHLISELAGRQIRIMGIEEVEAEKITPALPPLMRGGKAAPLEAIEGKRNGNNNAAAAASPSAKEPASLVVETPIRSGQSIVFLSGDITVIGSVGSGAEVVAGGSIHIYGALRGRAMAGTSGNRAARIFCNRMEAELLAIDGFYRTADDIEDSHRAVAIQAWLEGETLKIANLGGQGFEKSFENSLEKSLDNGQR